MSEMVERVARGMHLRRPNSRITRWEDCSDEYRTGTMRDAHAAIEAMRACLEEQIGPNSQEYAAAVDLIDAALK